jgi:hypothetical protein
MYLHAFHRYLFRERGYRTVLRNDIFVGHGEERSRLRGEALEYFLLTAFPNPTRTGCPTDDVLRSIAEGRLPADDPAQLHVGSCSECYAEYRHYRMDWEQLHGAGPAPLAAVTTRRVIRVKEVCIALAATIIVAFCIRLTLLHYRSRDSQQMAAVTEAVDLSGDGTSRGAGNEEPTSPLITLPAKPVRLNILLPLFSEKGSYVVGVSPDNTGEHFIASAVGTTVEQTKDELLLRVTLNLQGVKQGSYFLATMRQSDGGAYYYPLQIRSQ